MISHLNLCYCRELDSLEHLATRHCLPSRDTLPQSLTEHSPVDISKERSSSLLRFGEHSGQRRVLTWEGIVSAAVVRSASERSSSQATPVVDHEFEWQH